MGHFPENLLESGWLAALVVVPVFFNIHGERIFEEEKVLILRSVAVLSAVFGVVRLLERRKFRESQPPWRIPLILPFLLVIAAHLLSTAFSIDPKLSFWGGANRLQGTYTSLSIFSLFFIIVMTLRSQEQIDRIVTILLAGSLPVALYGIAQFCGLDPIAWSSDFQGRITSTAGNPIFLSGYLIMIVPLTIIRLIEQLGYSQNKLNFDFQSPFKQACALETGVYGLLLAVQLSALLLSQSRGPMVGLLAGLLVFLLIMAKQCDRPLWGLWGIIAASAVLGFLVVFNMPHSPLAAWQEVPFLGRLSSVFKTDPVRFHIWQGVCNLLAENPWRLILGYGPETLYAAILRHIPPELFCITRFQALPDRAHNETFDLLTMFGVVGFGAQVIFFGSLSLYILRWLGEIDSARERFGFLALFVSGGIAGWLLPLIVKGDCSFSGIGTAAGMACGIVVFLVCSLYNKSPTNHATNANSLLLAALFSALIGHLLEIHFGIATVSTRLLFWVYAALALATGFFLPQSNPSANRLQDDCRESESAIEEELRDRDQTTLLSLSLMMGLLLSVLIFDFVSSQYRSTRSAILIPILLLSTWIVGGAMVAVPPAGTPEQDLDRPYRWALYSAVSLGVAVSYLLLQLGWLHLGRVITGGGHGETSLRGADHEAFLLIIFYLWVLAIAVVHSLVLMPKAAPSPSPGAAKGAIIYAMLLVAAMFIIYSTNLRFSLADVYSKQGRNQEASKHWDDAIGLYREAIARQGDQSRYPANLGRVLVIKGELAGDQRDEWFSQAVEAYLEAQRSNRLGLDPLRQLGTAYRIWANLSKEEAARETRFDLAEEFCAEAITLSPNMAILWSEWALPARDRGRFEEAMERLVRAQNLCPGYEVTYMLMADIHIAQKDWPAARDCYFEATQQNPAALEGWTGLAFACTRMGDLGCALEASLRALEIRPDDLPTRFNVALLLGKTGDTQQAMVLAERILAEAPPQADAAVEKLLQELFSVDSE